MSIQIKARNTFNCDELRGIHLLRAKVFQERLGWDVRVENGMEIDDYDALEPHYMMICDDVQSVCGCWRMLPTNGPYMLKDTFPELLHGREAPQDGRVWELSRFAMREVDSGAFGFAGQTMEAMREVVRFADTHGIVKYVTVTTPAMERLLRHTGLEITRFGPPLRIGVAHAVGLEIHLGQKTHTALFGEFH